METELDVIDALEALSYTGNCLQNDILTAALTEGLRNADFQALVVWLTHELHVLRKTDEHVSIADEGVDVSEFTIELSSLLKELGCPFTQFVIGPLSERFQDRTDRILLLEYLVTELMATKMAVHQQPAQEQQFVISKNETDTARALDQLAKELSLGQIPSDVSAKAFFDKLNFKVEEQLRSVKPAIISEPLLWPNKGLKTLNDAQWAKLDDIHAELDKEYNLRRQMLLTRLEVTIQSFQWSDKSKNRENDIVNNFQSKLKELEPLRHGGKDTDIVALLAARVDQAIIEKTSSATVRKNTGSKIQKHVIGSVPDRGGRAHEHAPPPPEMPSWQQQRAGGPAGGGGGRGRGGRGGGGGGRGGGDGGRGGGGGGGGNWQQNQQRNQRPQFQQQQQHQQYQQQNQDQSWMGGSGRVQGTGWVTGAEYDRNGGGRRVNQYDDGSGGGGGGGRGGRGGRGGAGNRGGNNYRGHSNYNRGGY